MNFDNFWDGRARFHFNGGSVFGPSDPQRHIFISAGPLTAITGATNRNIRPDLYPIGADGADQPVRIKFSSLASQAVGPPLSDFEMSFAGRNWAKLGKKLLQPSPLQVLGGFGNPVPGLYYSLSDDLINWSASKVFMHAELPDLTEMLRRMCRELTPA